MLDSRELTSEWELLICIPLRETTASLFRFKCISRISNDVVRLSDSAGSALTFSTLRVIISAGCEPRIGISSLAYRRGTAE
jgi:hypothetical protein